MSRGRGALCILNTPAVSEVGTSHVSWDVQVGSIGAAGTGHFLKGWVGQEVGGRDFTEEERQQ